MMFKKVFGKRERCDMLIVMDGVSGLANKSPAFVCFLRAKRNLNIFVCIFFTFYIRGKQNDG